MASPRKFGESGKGNEDDEHPSPNMDLDNAMEYRQDTTTTQASGTVAGPFAHPSQSDAQPQQETSLPHAPEHGSSDADIEMMGITPDLATIHASLSGYRGNEQVHRLDKGDGDVTMTGMSTPKRSKKRKLTIGSNPSPTKSVFKHRKRSSLANSATTPSPSSSPLKKSKKKKTSTRMTDVTPKPIAETNKYFQNLPANSEEIPFSASETEETEPKTALRAEEPDFFASLPPNIRALLPFVRNKSNPVSNRTSKTIKKFDLISSISSNQEIVVEVGKYLAPRDIVNLYCISRIFHGTVDNNLTSCLRNWTDIMAPTSARVFPFRLYRECTILDPTGRPQLVPTPRATPRRRTASEKIRHQKEEPLILAQKMAKEKGKAKAEPRQISHGSLQPPDLHRNAPTPIIPGTIRSVPSIRWFQMVVSRERKVRDILACLARYGLRLPPTMHLTLKKMWLLMDCPTNAGRASMISDRGLFSRWDLLNILMFIIKLNMRFRDPRFGPGSSQLVQLMLGQRSGLHCLWQLLRRKRFHVNPNEIMALKHRYDRGPTPEQAKRGLPVFGVPLAEMGRLHREGWGAGLMHLLRPDELMHIEMARRHIKVERHLRAMAIWGFFDFRTHKRVLPTEKEMYISDDDLSPAEEYEEGEDDEEGKNNHGNLDEVLNKACGNVPFNSGEWTPRLILKQKKRWQELPDETKLAINVADMADVTRQEAWEHLSDSDTEFDTDAAELDTDADDEDEVEEDEEEYEDWDEDWDEDDDPAQTDELSTSGNTAQNNPSDGMPGSEDAATTNVAHMLLPRLRSLCIDDKLGPKEIIPGGSGDEEDGYDGDKEEDNEASTELSKGIKGDYNPAQCRVLNGYLGRAEDHQHRVREDIVGESAKLHAHGGPVITAGDAGLLPSFPAGDPIVTENYQQQEQPARAEGGMTGPGAPAPSVASTGSEDAFDNEDFLDMMEDAESVNYETYKVIKLVTEYDFKRW